MIQRLLLVSILANLFFINVMAQEINIDIDNQPLNKVLVELRDRYDLQLSFDDDQLSAYYVSCYGSFSSGEKALSTLLTGLPLSYEINGSVFIIYYVEPPPEPVLYKISGQVLEVGSQEPLPFSHVIVNNNGLVTDLNGNFSYLSKTDSIFKIRTSYLGYYILDTVLDPGHSYKLYLKPAVLGLSQIVIKDRVIEKSMQIGERPGVMKLNHKVANFLPGYGDNSVFNLLRLQPGILAAGEQTNELIIWGSYAGHSQVLFDGFIVYGLKNFNDNISAFNPLVAKNLEIYKGGYGARLGGRVGGVVDITGKNGSRDKTSFTFSINNMTMNGIVEVPLFKRSTFLLSFRYTYYNLYDPEVLSTKKNNENDQIDINLIPDYKFRDINIKYSANFKNNDLFYVSLYGANDQYSYLIDEKVLFRKLMKNTAEKNTQSGGSVYYGKTWKNGNTSNLHFVFSNIKSNYSDNFQVANLVAQEINIRADEDSENSVAEASLKLENRFTVGSKSQLEAGMAFTSNRVKLHEDTFGVTRANLEAESSRLELFVQNRMSLGPYGHLKGGIRLYYVNSLQKAYLDPRLSATFNLGDFVKMNMAWGIYHQFITKTSIVDELGNYRYLWSICNNDDIPVLDAQHWVWGLSFFQNDWSVNFETYYKTTNGITRFVRFNALNYEDIFEGDSRSYGFDIMVKMDFNKHSGWISYTLGKTEEHFSYFRHDNYVRAPHDQRHELKLAVLLNFDPFYFSTNYVFGSGFPENFSYQPGEDPGNLQYSRCDISVIYKFLDRKVKGETGISILNVLNTQNIKYTNFERIPSYQTNSINIYAEAIPFTPTLYLKISM